MLVERVEKFAKKEEWQRAYREINEFERALTDDGMVLVKFWLHISKKEQLDRFKKREKDPWKNWKLTDEDWRNARSGTSTSMRSRKCLIRPTPSMPPDDHRGQLEMVGTHQGVEDGREPD